VADNFFAGGVGGFFCWVFSYPQDIIKTRLQVARENIYPKLLFRGVSLPDGGMVNCGREIYRAEGMRGFWQGFSACTARAIFANSLMFAAYEFAQKNYILSE
jgi:solute carrier family 25 carnitine/acylcarnitine transporter 20/29